MFLTKPFTLTNILHRSLRMSSTVSNLQSVLHNIDQLSSELKLSYKPRLVAVSKTKPAEQIKECYDAGQLHFGENYVQELTTKAPELPKDIKWHFIGQLQTNKAKAVASVENLHLVESVDRQKLAVALNTAAEKLSKEIKILVQVNPANEVTKGGVSGIEDLLELVEFIVNNCKHLEFNGLMVIGRPHELEDMHLLIKYKEAVLEKYPQFNQLNPFELSMGMSADYQEAIKMGSTNVRVGSTIFGERNYNH